MGGKVFKKVVVILVFFSLSMVLILILMINYQKQTQRFFYLMRLLKLVSFYDIIIFSFK
jgi:hypothetical protein